MFTARRLLAAAAVVAAFAPLAAQATDGYFSHGYGMKGKGRGGASTAMSDDAFGGANNPASMVWAGDRLDVGVDWFMPKRDALRSGSSPFLNIDGSAKSGSDNFLIPEFGYNKMLNPRTSVGVTVYGNGGMNTNYPGDQIPAASACAPFNPSSAGPYNLLCGNGRLNMDLMQLIVAPTVAMKIGERNSLGIAPLFGWQRFKVDGLQGFQGFTPNPATFSTDNHLTNRGYDSSTGLGVRFGWMGKLSDRLSLGAAYATKMKMSKFDKYRDLFANQGEFDIPENWNLGVAFHATPVLTIAADYQRINYGGLASVGNPSTNVGNSVALTGFTVGSLGCATCRGFGWQNVNVIKIGVEWQYNSNLALRAGYNHTDNPIQARDVTFNIIAPGVVQDHVTAGLTYAFSKSSELTFAYMHAFKKSVTGSSLYNNFTAPLPAGTETISLSENSLGVAWGWKY